MKLKRKNITIIGASIIVGLQLSLLLLKKGNIIDMSHKDTKFS